MTPLDPIYDTSLAIVGMACRFPDAATPEAYWQNMAAGVCSIRQFTEAHLRQSGVPEEQWRHPDYVRAGTVLEGIDLFDAAFFGYTPREAELMDPQHRLFLECAWNALEDAGYVSDAHDLKIGVFAGSGPHSYKSHCLMMHPEILQAAGDLQLSVANDMDSLCSTVSYKLNLTGPSFGVQTFCSTSLVAVHLACQSLLTYECDLALAGGVALRFPHAQGYLFQEGGILSPDGHCRAFDRNAQGSVLGDGGGLVVLKRLEEALRDGDALYAIIRGSAVNNDGRERVGYTAPGLAGQAAVMAEALAQAGVPAQSLGYLEAHGTGTPLGDAVELAAIQQVLGSARAPFCALGSAKPAIGHLDRASGVAGLMRGALALQHAQLPPTLDWSEPSAQVDWSRSPVWVNTQLRPWERGASPRRAGVSSFGLGGTNAHVILEEAPSRAASSASTGWQVLAVSARTPEALETALGNLGAYLAEHPQSNLADVAYTLQVGRKAFSERAALVCRTGEEARAILQGEKPSRLLRGHVTGTPGVSLLLGGVGEQTPELGREFSAGEALDSSVSEGLRSLVSRWVSGETVGWEELHRGERRRRLSLPTYPFQRQRFWVEPKVGQWVFQTAAEKPGSVSTRLEPEDWFHIPVWQHSLPLQKMELPVLSQKSLWLLFADTDSFSDILSTKLVADGARVARVYIGERFEVRGPNEFMVAPDNLEDYVALLRHLQEPPQSIVHLWNLNQRRAEGTKAEHFARAQTVGFYSLLYLVKAMNQRNLVDSIELWLLSQEVQCVSAGETLQPEQGTMQGMARVIAQEQLNILFGHIDLDRPEAGSWQEQKLAAHVLSELRFPPPELPIAYRNNVRWIQKVESVRLSATMPFGSSLRQRGVYLITGGLGKVGFTLAEHLTQSYQAHVILVGRSPFPAPEDWQQWLAAHASTDAISLRINRILEWEAAGASIQVRTADVADEEQMQSVFEEIQVQFGCLHGVFHAAGVSDDSAFGTIQTIGVPACEQHFRPKAIALFTLEKVLAPFTPDFCVLFSSLSAILGGLGLVAYAAANSFTDAFVYAHNQLSPTPWMSINWDTWRFPESEPAPSPLGTTIAEYNMSAQEGMMALETILTHGMNLPQVILSTGNLEARLEQWVRNAGLLRQNQADTERPQASYPRPNLNTVYVAASTEWEQTIVETWQNVLGFDRVGIHDNFLDLGGHSLLAIQLMTRLRQTFRVNLPLTLLFTAPTVAELAEAIELAVIADIEQLSEEEALRLI